MTRSLLFGGLLIFAANHCCAQFRNIQLDHQGPEDPYVCEPSIAINPRNPQNIVAGSVLNNVYVTLDSGKQWQKIKLESPFGVYGDPSIVADNKGNFFYFHLSDPTNGTGGYDSEKLDRIVVQESNDGGLTWSPGESIGLNHPKDQDKQWPSVDTKGNLYVTWTEFDKYGDESPNCLSRILFSKSRNGKKWSAPLELSQTPGNCKDDDNTVEGAVPAINSDGKVFVAWANQEKIFFDRSFDGGTTWLTNDLAIADQPGGWEFRIPGHDRCNGMPVLVANNSKTNLKGQLYVVWADQRNGEDDTDIWFTRTSNHGDNWTPVLRVNDDEKGKHQYLPWVTVDPSSGIIYILYYDRRNHEGAETDVYLAFSTNGGNSFTNVKINERSFTPVETTFFGDYLNISAQRGIIAPIWTTMENGVTSVWTAVITQEELMKFKAVEKSK
jgi:hypothetical protein